MPTFLAEIISQLKTIWARLDGGQRMTIGAVLLATTIGLGAIVWYAGQPDYQTVYSSEDPMALAEAEALLVSSGIPYRTNGLRLEVDRDDASAASTSLRAGGALSQKSDAGSGLGGLTASGEEKKRRLWEQKERHAELALRAMAGVSKAMVRGSKPKRHTFTTAFDEEEQQRATATLTLRAGVSFRRLASSSVDMVASTLGVQPDNITIINAATGEKFNGSVGSHMGDDGGDFLKQQKLREQEAKEKITRALTPYVDNFSVEVTVLLDPNYSFRDSVYVPESPIVIEETTTKEDSKDADKVVGGGDPSLSSQAAEATANTTASGGSSKSSTTTKKYLAEAGRERVGKLAPDIKMISVGLIVDKKLQGEDGIFEADIRKVVEAAVGKDVAAGGDGVVPKVLLEIAFMERLPMEEPEAIAGPGLGDMAEKYGGSVAQLLAVALVLFFLRSMLKKGKNLSVPQGKKAAAPVDLEAQAKAREEEEMLLPPTEKAKRMRQEIEEAIGDDPAAISRMLENWLTETSK